MGGDHQPFLGAMIINADERVGIGIGMGGFIDMDLFVGQTCV